MTRVPSAALWVVQAVLAMLFLFAGGMKLALPLEQLAGPIALPGAFIRSIGVAKVLGAVGLIVPWLTGIRPGLTPLAAGLVSIRIGATVLTALAGDLVAALILAVVGLLAALVAWGRWPKGAAR